MTSLCILGETLILALNTAAAAFYSRRGNNLQELTCAEFKKVHIGRRLDKQSSDPKDGNLSRGFKFIKYSEGWSAGVLEYWLKV